MVKENVTGNNIELKRGGVFERNITANNIENSRTHKNKNIIFIETDGILSQDDKTALMENGEIELIYNNGKTATCVASQITNDDPDGVSPVTEIRYKKVT